GFSACNKYEDSSFMCHFPCLSIPISTTSYAVRSIASTIFLADCKETSCSAVFPPNIIPTFFLFIIFYPLHVISLGLNDHYSLYYHINISKRQTPIFKITQTSLFHKGIKNTFKKALTVNY